jgi:hypothetical protein
MIRIQLHTQGGVYGTISQRVGKEWTVSLARKSPMETVLNDLHVWLLAVEPSALHFVSWGPQTSKLLDLLCDRSGYILGSTQDRVIHRPCTLESSNEER